MDEMRSEMALFNDFWGDVEKLSFHFNKLTDSSQTSAIVSAISKHIGVSSDEKLYPVPLKKEKKKVYLRKILTRLLGKYAPVINTTVGFSKTKK